MPSTWTAGLRCMQLLTGVKTTPVNCSLSTRPISLLSTTWYVPIAPVRREVPLFYIHILNGHDPGSTQETSFAFTVCSEAIL